MFYLNYSKVKDDRINNIQRREKKNNKQTKLNHINCNCFYLIIVF